MRPPCKPSSTATNRPPAKPGRPTTQPRAAALTPQRQPPQGVQIQDPVPMAFQWPSSSVMRGSAAQTATNCRQASLSARPFIVLNAKRTDPSPIGCARWNAAITASGFLRARSALKSKANQNPPARQAERPAGHQLQARRAHRQQHPPEVLGLRPHPKAVCVKHLTACPVASREFHARHRVARCPGLPRSNSAR